MNLSDMTLLTLMWIFVVFLTAMPTLGPTLKTSQQLNMKTRWMFCRLVSDSLCCVQWVHWLWVSLSFRLFILTTPNCQRRRWVTQWFHLAYTSPPCFVQSVNLGKAALHNADYDIVALVTFFFCLLFSIVSLLFSFFLQTSLCLFQKTSICYLSFPDSNSGELLFLQCVCWNIYDGHLWLKNAVN